MATISLWRNSSPGEGKLELANAPTNPCYHHIDATYGCSMYYQLSNPFCLCPGQQTTVCSASSTRMYKMTANSRKYHSSLDGHCYKDSGLRLARWEGPMPLTVPVQQEVARETLTPLVPMNWASHLLRGMLNSYNRKKESRMAVVKRQRSEKPVKIEHRMVQGPE